MGLRLCRWAGANKTRLPQRWRSRGPCPWPHASPMTSFRRENLRRRCGSSRPDVRRAVRRCPAEPAHPDALARPALPSVSICLAVAQFSRRWADSPPRRPPLRGSRRNGNQRWGALMSGTTGESGACRILSAATGWLISRLDRRRPVARAARPCFSPGVRASGIDNRGRRALAIPAVAGRRIRRGPIARWASFASFSSLIHPG